MLLTKPKVINISIKIGTFLGRILRVVTIAIVVMFGIVGFPFFLIGFISYHSFKAVKGGKPEAGINGQKLKS